MSGLDIGERLPIHTFLSLQTVLYSSLAFYQLFRHFPFFLLLATCFSQLHNMQMPKFSGFTRHILLSDRSLLNRTISKILASAWTLRPTYVGTKIKRLVLPLTHQLSKPLPLTPLESLPLVALCIHYHHYSSLQGLDTGELSHPHQYVKPQSSTACISGSLPLDTDDSCNPRFP